MKKARLITIGFTIIITGIILTIILLFDISIYMLIILFGVGVLLLIAVGFIQLMKYIESHSNINKLSTSLNAALKQLNNNQIKLHRDITAISTKLK